MDFKDKMEQDFKYRITNGNTNLTRSELLQGQITDYKQFIKYLNFYIDEINLRLRRLEEQLKREEERSKKSAKK